MYPHNFGPHLTWLVKERPFAVPNRRDVAVDPTLPPPVEAPPTPQGSPFTVPSRPIQTPSRPPPPVPRNIQFSPQFQQEDEDMARLRIESTSKRPKLSSRVAGGHIDPEATPRASNQASATTQTPAVKNPPHSSSNDLACIFPYSILYWANCLMSVYSILGHNSCPIT